MTFMGGAQNYTDISGLAELRRQSRKDPHEARAEVARQFEAMFVQLMLKQMREASPATEDSLLGQGGQMYRDLLDKQLGIEMASAGGVGLARQIESALAASDRGSSAQADEPAQGAAGSGLVEGAPSLRMPRVPNAEARARAAEAALARVQRSLDALEGDPFNSDIATAAAMAPAVSGSVEAASADAQAWQPSGTRGSHRFESPEDFVRSLRGAAQGAARSLGATPDVLLAQAALETGWGQHVMRGAQGENSHNLFGIKADSRWQGPTVEVTTTEYRHGHAVREKARFRAYASYEESFRDYVDFLQQNPRYERALAVTERPHQFIQALQHAGYATDPQYARKVVAVMRADAFDAGSAPAAARR
jgi:peptidoglycan hydrolase FlgJ